MINFVERGYYVHTLSAIGRDLVSASREIVRNKLGVLEDYHKNSPDDITMLQNVARNAIAKMPRVIVEAELQLFKLLIGPDISIQKLPYLRISRPGIDNDNIGMHRDTWYGDSPYELSVWIPLTDTTDANALRVAVGSHLWAEGETMERKAQAEKGSVRHSLGFLYAPKRISREFETIALPVRVGQMIVFNLALVHGVEANASQTTRISMDVRVTGSFFPVQWERSRGEHYEPLSVSPVSEQAKNYYAAQA